MNEFVQFALQHWVLFFVLVIILVLIIQSEMASTVAGMTQLSPQELTHKLNREKVLLLDLRTKEDFKAGHIAGAMNIPMEELESRLAKIKKYKDKPVILYGSNMQLAAKAAAVLKKEQYEQLFTLKGGLAAWEQDNLPLVK